MDKNVVIDVLRAHRAELEELGVRHAALFGSVARGEARPDSDIDIAVELDAGLVRTVYDYVGVQQFIGQLFQDRVDVVERGSLKPKIRKRMSVDLLHAF